MEQDEQDRLDQKWADRGDEAYRRFTDHPKRYVGKWILGFVVLVVALSLIGNALGIANIYWSAEQAKLTVKPRVTQSVYQTQNALVNISFFHNQCNNVVADVQNVENVAQTLAGDEQTFQASTDAIAQQQAGEQVTQDRTNLLGAKDQLAADVRTYDAKSADLTANPFKAHNLPYRINVNPSTGLPSAPVNCH